MKFTRSTYRLSPPFKQREELIDISDDNTVDDLYEALAVLKDLVVILPHPYTPFGVDRMWMRPKGCWCGYPEHSGIHYVAVIQPEPMDVVQLTVRGEPSTLVNNMVDWSPLRNYIATNKLKDD